MQVLVPSSAGIAPHTLLQDGSAFWCTCNFFRSAMRCAQRSWQVGGLDIAGAGAVVSAQHHLLNIYMYVWRSSQSALLVDTIPEGISSRHL
jgi:hypothetical protein